MDENVLTKLEPTYIYVDDMLYGVDENAEINNGDDFVLIIHQGNWNECKSVCKMIEWDHNKEEGTFLAYDYAKDCNFTCGIHTMHKIIKDIS